MKLIRRIFPFGSDEEVVFEASASCGKDGKYRMLIHRTVSKDGVEIERKFHAVGLPQGRGTQEEAQNAAEEMLGGKWEWVED